MNDDELTNLHGIKRALNLPYDWLRREALAGRLPCLKIGRQLRFNVHAVRAALAYCDKGNEAIGRVLQERASVPAAMTHPELGAITFDWGVPGDPAKDYEGGWGVSHVLSRHGKTVVREIPKVIASGKIARQYGPPSGQRVDISDGTHTAVLSLHRFGKRETWLLTGWKEKGPDEPGSDSALSGPTPFGPTLNRPEGGAGPTSIIGATGPEVKPAAPPPSEPHGLEYSRSSVRVTSRGTSPRRRGGVLRRWRG